MIVTVLWEDQRGVQIKGFGPHELLMSCVGDALNCSRRRISQFVTANPQKGNGNVRKALVRNLMRLSNDGPVGAVLDYDRVLELWPEKQRPASCFTGICQALAQQVPGPFKLFLLERNIETLVIESCVALGDPRPSGKPSPDERDRVLTKLAWSENPDKRKCVRDVVPSFERLVRWVSEQVQTTV